MNDLDPGLPGTIWQWLVGVVLTGAGVQKVLRMYSADRTGRFAEDGKADIVQGLREELARLQAHNMMLVTEFEKAQTKIVRIAAENHKLQLEIEELKAAVAKMIRTHGAIGG